MTLTDYAFPVPQRLVVDEACDCSGVVVSALRAVSSGRFGLHELNVVVSAVSVGHVGLRLWRYHVLGGVA